MQAVKSKLRARMLARRRALSEHEWRTASARAIHHLLGWLAAADPAWDLLCYRAFDKEIDTTPIFAAPPRANLYAPVVRGEAMLWRRAQGAWKPGAFGILEPQGELWDGAEAIVVCPLVAFDRRGGRLGMGKGYFDRWLAAHQAKLRAVVGLAYAWQEVDRVPCEPHDVRLHYVITEREVIRCR